MIDLSQILLLVIILVLTVFLIVLGVQVFFILKDLRRTITKLNRFLNSAEEITNSIKEPASAFSSFVSGLKASGGIIDFFKKKKDHDGK